MYDVTCDLLQKAVKNLGVRKIFYSEKYKKFMTFKRVSYNRVENFTNLVFLVENTLLW